MKWNEQQLKAIETCFVDDEPGRRCNILVNAAAGSGKTAVLVERIIRKIENCGGSDVDRLLVVTFTKAAAAEMQQKINRALIERMEDVDCSEEKRAHLMRQLRLLSGADICNIDSYCIRVVRNNFHLLGIDPNFSPVTSGELEIMKDEAIDLLFEELYENESEDNFIRLVETLSETGNDRGLADIIKKLYNFTTSLPEPEEWLDNAVERIADLSVDMSLEETCKDVYETADEVLRCAAENIIKICRETAENAVSEGDELSDEYTKDVYEYSLAEALEKASELIEKYPPEGDNPVNLRWGSAWEKAADDYKTVFPMYGSDWKNTAILAAELKIKSFPTEISTIRYKLNGKTIKENDKALDNDTEFELIRKSHELIKEKCKQLSSRTPEKLETDIKEVKDFTLCDTRELCRLTKLFMKKLETLKQRRGVFEFSDIERLVYRLIRDNPDIKKEYNEKYDEILIDEYQDVNALQDAIFTSISNGDNLFMVGDMKQSIYRFRNSDPTIFKHKTDTYHDKYNRVINLNRNYRSREAVLESINNVFSVIMSEKAGEIDYDDTQRLNAGDTDYENINAGMPTDNRSELVLIKSDEESDDDKVTVEATYVARRIKAMIDDGFKVRRTTTDENGNQKHFYDNVSPRDFAILADSTKYIVEIYEEALKREGILCYAESEGYFDKNEIMAVMSIVKMIDNPLDDIAFAASMRLPVCGFIDDELAQIRLAGGKSMYECAVNMSSADTELGRKCARFISMLEEWRFCAKIMPCDRLIMTIYEQTDLYAYCGTLENGAQLQANLRMLSRRARDYENTGYKGLFNFIRYIDKMRSKSGDMSPAKLISEEHDVVRIMTMHKSKGLEFPVVFIVDSAKKFKIDANKTIICHKDKGIGLRYVNNDMRYSVPTVITQEIDRKSEIETIAERMRLLYVAMTRAKEKLIVTATERVGMQKLSFSYADNSRIVNSAKSFFEWLEPIAKADPLWKYSESTQIVDEQINQSEDKTMSEIPVDNKDSVFEWSYSDEKSTVSPAKISVTELKRRKLLADVQDGDSGQMFKRASVRKVPFFMEENKPLTGAQKGTVMHYIMQTLPVYANEKIIAEHIENLVKTGQLSGKEADSVDRKKILAFFSTDLANRIKNADKVYREVPFEFSASSSEVYGFDGDDVIIQGIIDCCFEENGEMVVVDYKTDYYNENCAHEIADKYNIQLNNYARAIEQITKKCVKSKYLYLFYRNDVIECN